MAIDEYGYDEYGLRAKTDFKENGFGIDPDGCGCTDCITGQSFNIWETFRIESAVRSGRTLYNRSGQEVILPNGVILADGDIWGKGPTDAPHCRSCTCNRAY